MLLAAGAEIFGLFVEDRLFALAIGIWLGATAAANAAGFGSPQMRCAALFAGLAAILLVNVMLTAASMPAKTARR